MPYDRELADRLRELLSTEKSVTEKAMFGGLAFLIGGNMAVAAGSQGGLMLRIDPADCATLVKKAHAERMVMRGRELDGWLRIDAAGIKTKKALTDWVTHGVDYAKSLPDK